MTRRIKPLRIPLFYAVLLALALPVSGLVIDDLPPTVKIQKRTQVRIERVRRARKKPGSPGPRPPAERYVTVQLDSVPSGAEVYVGTSRQGLTPCLIKSPMLGRDEAATVTLSKRMGSVRFGASVFLRDVSAGARCSRSGLKLQAEAVTDASVPATSVLGKTREEIERYWGALIRDKSQKDDWAEWYESADRGVKVRFHQTHWQDVKQQPRKADLVRVVALQGGRIAGLTVGSGESEVRERLGEPTVYEGESNVLSYLDNGVRFAIDAGRVRYIEVSRSEEALRKGFAAFVPPDRPQFHLQVDLVGQQFPADLRASAEQKARNAVLAIPIANLTDSPYDADYKVRVEVLKPTVTRAWKSEERKRSKKQGGGKYTVYYTEVVANATVHLTVVDTGSGKPVGGMSRLPKSSSETVRIYQSSSDGDTTDYGDAYYARSVMEQAIWDLRGPLHRVASISGKVFKVDYQQNRVYVNLGRNQGICMPNEVAGREVQFDLSVDGKLLWPESERERRFCVVEAVQPDFCIVSLKKKVSQFPVGTVWKNDWDALRALPDPGSGSVTAVTRVPAVLEK